MSCASSPLRGHGCNVTIRAGNTYTQTRSNVLAPDGDIDICAKRVHITEARETSSSQIEEKSSQSGLSVGVSNPVTNAVQSMGGIASASATWATAACKRSALPPWA